MRKLFVSILAAAFVFSSSMANAASVGGKLPEKGKLIIGAETNFITEKDVKNVTQNQAAKLKSNQYLAVASYGILDRLALKLKLGTGDLRYTDVDDKLNTDEGFLWGIGIDSEAYRNENGLRLLLGAQYFSAGDLDTESKYLDPNDTFTFESWREWQISALIAKDMARFMPYLGIKYSDFEIDGKWYDSSAAATTTSKIKEDDNVGVFLGTDYKISEACSLNLEGRFIDERAVSAGISWKF